MALKFCMFIGSNPKWILLGLLSINGFLSIWVSNAAVASMMLPISVSIARQLVELDSFYSSTANNPRSVTGIRYTSMQKYNTHILFLLFTFFNQKKDISTIELSEIKYIEPKEKPKVEELDDKTIFAPPRANKLLKCKYITWLPRVLDILSIITKVCVI